MLRCWLPLSTSNTYTTNLASTFSLNSNPRQLAPAHCLAELYAQVTGMPGKDRASPDEALLFLQDVRTHLTLVTLDEMEYFAVLLDASSAGIVGGGIYYTIIARCALTAKAEAIYTWNLKHCKRLGEPVAARVREP